MKKFKLILLILALGYSCFSAIIFIRIIPEHFFPGKGQWKLVWEDDFNGTSLEQTEWVAVERGGGYQEVISIANPKNVTIKNGCLILADKKEDWIGEDIFHPGQTVGGQYTCGQVATKSNYNGGRFEICAKLPAGKGLFSYANLYTIGGQSSREILIMGMLGYNPYTIFTSNHWGSNQPYHYLEDTVSGKSYGPDFSAGFHTFAVEWDSRVIRWYIDDLLINQTDQNIPEIPLILNIGTGLAGELFDIPKFGGRPTILPQYLKVDWVRVYRRR